MERWDDTRFPQRTNIGDNVGSGFGSFGLLDGLLLAAARSVGERVLTFDRDFPEEEDCLLLP